MAHSAVYQTEKCIQNLEQLAQELEDQGRKIRDNGYSALAMSVLDQAQQLRLAIVTLRNEISEKSDAEHFASRK